MIVTCVLVKSGTASIGSNSAALKLEREIKQLPKRKKEALVEKIKVFRDFKTDRIKEWNEKTKEVLAIQKEWEAIGGLPKDKAKDINKKFWGAFKKFFRNKNQFFKKLDALLFLSKSSFFASNPAIPVPQESGQDRSWLLDRIGPSLSCSQGRSYFLAIVST